MDFRDAERAFQHALKLQRQLADGFPDDWEKKHEFAILHLELAEFLAVAARAKEAETSFRAALDTLAPLVKLSPAVDAYRWDLIRSYRGMALLLQETDRFKAAAADCCRVLETTGTDDPTNAVDYALLATFCQERKSLYLAASRFFRQAFTADLNLAESWRLSHRYNAACAAALAGCGQGNDATDLDDVQKSLWRRQALDWLRADLTLWTKLLEQPPANLRMNLRLKSVPKTLQQLLTHWQKDTDFAGVRGPASLAKLPVAERQAWGQFWRDVEMMLSRLRNLATANEKA